MEEKEAYQTRIYAVGNPDWSSGSDGVYKIGGDPITTVEEKSMYRFFVGDVADIDIPRICREAEEDGRDTLLIPDKNDKGLLLAKLTFLEGFEFEDGLFLAGEPLWEHWGGERGVAYAHRRGGIVFDSLLDTGKDIEYKIAQLDPDWRCKIIVLNQVPVIVGELKKARRYHRRIQVKVHYL